MVLTPVWEPLVIADIIGLKWCPFFLFPSYSMSTSYWMLYFRQESTNFQVTYQWFNLKCSSLYAAVRCSENLMTCSNLATVFTPCLLPPPNKAEMSEERLELRVLVLRTFIENPHLFGNKPVVLSWHYHEIKGYLYTLKLRSSQYLPGVIPKAVMDSMEFLMNSHLVKDSKRGHRKRPSFKGKTYKPLEICWSQLKTPVCSFNFNFLKYLK